MKIRLLKAALIALASLASTLAPAQVVSGPVTGPASAPYSLPSTSDLRLYAGPETGSTVTVGGRNGGVFEWLKDETAADDGVNYFRPNSMPSSGRWRRVEPSAKAAFIADRALSGGGVLDDSAYLNNLIATYGSVYLPCGTYVLVASPILLPSNSSLQGAGACTVIKAAATLATNPNWSTIPGTSANGRALVTNSDYSAGNSDIQISDLTIDASAAPATTHGMPFYKVAGARVSNVRMIGSGNQDTQSAIAFINSSDYTEVGLYAYNWGNACFDQWDGSHDGQVIGGQCEGNNVTKYGLLVNGLATNNTANTSYRISLVGNIIRNVTQAGAYLSGLCSGTTCGAVEDIDATGNHIFNSAKIGAVLGDGSRIKLSGGTINTTGEIGVYIASVSTGAGTTNAATVENVSVTNVSQSAANTYAAFQLGSGSDFVNDTSLIGNAISGTSHSVAYRMRGGSNRARIWTAQMTPSASGGVILDQGIQTTINGQGLPRTITTATAGQTTADTSLIFNATANHTITLLNPAQYPGRRLLVKNIANFTVVSASANVVPLAGGAAGTAILAANGGSGAKTAELQSDGTNWVILTAN